MLLDPGTLKKVAFSVQMFDNLDFISYLIHSVKESKSKLYPSLSETEFSVPGVRRESRDGGPHAAVASSAAEHAVVWALARVVLFVKT